MKMLTWKNGHCGHSRENNNKMPQDIRRIAFYNDQEKRDVSKSEDKRNFRDWDELKVQNWLKEIGLGKYCELFQDEFINGGILDKLEMSFMLEDLMMSKSDAKRLVKERNKFN